MKIIGYVLPQDKYKVITGLGDYYFQTKKECQAFIDKYGWNIKPIRVKRK